MEYSIFINYRKVFGLLIGGLFKILAGIFLDSVPIEVNGKISMDFNGL